MPIGKTGAIILGTVVAVIVFVTVGEYFLDLSLLHGSFASIVHSNSSVPYFTAFVNSTQKPLSQTGDPYAITVVTMYLNIGKFQKGTGGNQFTPDTYKNWMRTWGWLTNRVIGFFDSDEALETFREIRSSQPKDRTELIKLNRAEIPAFQNLEKIREIFNQPGYPRHPPNTVVPECSCGMNAKYDALQMALSRRLTKTKYIAWLDIGLFRNLLEDRLHPSGDRFTLEVPDNFNSSCVGMTEVESRKYLMNISAWDYISNNRVWVSGAFVLGTKEAVWKFSESYKRTVPQLLEKKMFSTDQQVIGAMYSPDYIKQQNVDMTTYQCSDGQFGLYGSDIQYFCLGYICKDAPEKRLKIETSTKSV